MDGFKWSQDRRGAAAFKLWRTIIYSQTHLLFPHSQSILRYESALHRTLAIFARALPLLLGLAKETQTLIVPMMEHFVEDQTNSVTKAIVSVSDSRLQVYSMQLHLVADFHGLRYVPYLFELFVPIEIACVRFIKWSPLF